MSTKDVCAECREGRAKQVLAIEYRYPQQMAGLQRDMPECEVTAN